jgi:hypothetical protein
LWDVEEQRLLSEMKAAEDWRRMEEEEEQYQSKIIVKPELVTKPESRGTPTDTTPKPELVKSARTIELPRDEPSSSEEEEGGRMDTPRCLPWIRNDKKRTMANPQNRSSPRNHGDPRNVPELKSIKWLPVCLNA